MPILPEFVGVTFSVQRNGHSFERVQVEPEMIGHFLGEFHLTRSTVEHGQAGIARPGPRSSCPKQPMGINYSVEADPDHRQGNAPTDPSSA